MTQHRLRRRRRIFFFIANINVRPINLQMRKTGGATATAAHRLQRNSLISVLSRLYRCVFIHRSWGYATSSTFQTRPRLWTSVAAAGLRQTSACPELINPVAQGIFSNISKSVLSFSCAFIGAPMQLNGLHTLFLVCLFRSIWCRSAGSRWNFCLLILHLCVPVRVEDRMRTVPWYI